MFGASSSKPDPHRFLRRALLVNASFSALCTLALATAGHLIAPRMGLTAAWPLWLVAAMLGPFAFAVFKNATGSQIDMAQARATSIADLVWVLATVVALIVWGHALTALGVALVVDVAVIVGAFAGLQLIALQRTRAPVRGGAA